MDQEGWAVVLSIMGSGLLISFTVGLSWGKMQSELHRICERLIEGFEQNDKNHEEMRVAQKEIRTIQKEAEVRLHDVDKRLSRMEGVD